MPIGTADGSLGRIDNICVRLDLTNRQITTVVVAGAYAASPVAPTPMRTVDVYDLVIARVRVAAGTTAITQALITDTRTDSALCGLVTGAVEQLDFSEYCAQLTTTFTEWFNEIKGQLSTDAAGNLQNEIDGLTAADVGAVPLTGVTMTGGLTLSGAPTTNLMAATKGYVDGSSQIVKLMDVTLATAANAVELNLSGIDMTKYAQLQLFYRNTDVTMIYLRLNNSSGDYSYMNSSGNWQSLGTYCYISYGGAVFLELCSDILALVCGIGAGLLKNRKARILEAASQLIQKAEAT
ncbi:MAG: hypothetical protein EOM14_09430, partial [Clostridia bacterium]|nr:hypothetical protein [Clostridia bacterium]